MAEVAIPAPSLERLRAAYAQFEQLATVVAEAMGIAPGEVKQVSLPNGVFIVGDDQPPEQQLLVPEQVNGVAA